MSSLKVEVVQVEKVEPHPNADRLEIATVKGWQCVVGKGDFIAGDKGFYFPLDAVLPELLLNFLFGGTKVKPPSRIRTIKLRGVISQGLLVRRAVAPCEALGGAYLAQEAAAYTLGSDVTELFGVTKYGPPVKEMPGLMRSSGQARVNHPDFVKFTDIENIKNYPHVFTAEDVVVITEKIHGTNFRCGWLPTHANTLWKRCLKFVGLLPDFEFVYGSRNVQLVDNQQTWYGNNVYAKMVAKYNLKAKLLPGEQLIAEVYGDGIQKGYNYGCAAGEHKLVAIDMLEDGMYVEYGDFAIKMDTRGIPTAPLLFCGRYDTSIVKYETVGHSRLAIGQLVREGCVVRGIGGRDALIGSKILKSINAEYLLLKDGTDWH